MLKFKLTLLCSLFSTLAATNWTITEPELISTVYSYTYQGVFNSCNPTQNSYLATWADGNNNQYPTYSFYSPSTGWSPLDVIATTGALISTNVITSYDPVSGNFLASWTDITTNNPTISLYTSGWGPSVALTGTTAAVNSANSFNSTGQFLLTWADTSNSNYPSFAFYTPGTGFSAVNTISNTSPAANVYTAFDSSNNQTLAIWVDIGTGFPMYSFFSSGSWSVASPISNSASVDNDVLSICNPNTGQFMATWADINQSLYPFYSIYTPGSGWSPIATITTTSGVTDNVRISCDTITGQYLASWSNVLNGNPTYAFYDPVNGWGEPQVISTLSSSRSDIITSFNSVTGNFLATWPDSSNPELVLDPTFSLFINPTPNISPPEDFSGKKLNNHFASQTDIINELKWNAPADTTGIVSYQISRNGKVIATIPVSDPTIYLDHHRRKNRSYTYTIVSLNASGNPSSSLSVRLK